MLNNSTISSIATLAPAVDCRAPALWETIDEDSHQGNPTYSTFLLNKQKREIKHKALQIRDLLHSRYEWENVCANNKALRLCSIYREEKANHKILTDIAQGLITGPLPRFKNYPNWNKPTISLSPEPSPECPSAYRVHSAAGCTQNHLQGLLNTSSQPPPQIFSIEMAAGVNPGIPGICTRKKFKCSWVGDPLLQTFAISFIALQLYHWIQRWEQMVSLPKNL